MALVNTPFVVQHVNYEGRLIFYCTFDLLVPANYAGNVFDTKEYNQYSNFKIYDTSMAYYTPPYGPLINTTEYDLQQLSIQYNKDPSLLNPALPYYANSTTFSLFLQGLSGGWGGCYFLNSLDPVTSNTKSYNRFNILANNNDTLITFSSNSESYSYSATFDDTFSNSLIIKQTITPDLMFNETQTDLVETLFVIKHFNSSGDKLFHCDIKVYLPANYVGNISDLTPYSSYSSFNLYNIFTNDPIPSSHYTIKKFFVQYNNSPNLQDTTKPNYANSVSFYLRIDLFSNTNFTYAYDLSNLDLDLYNQHYATQIFITPHDDSTTLELQNSGDYRLQSYSASFTTENETALGQIFQEVTPSLQENGNNQNLTPTEFSISHVNSTAALLFYCDLFVNVPPDYVGKNTDLTQYSYYTNFTLYDVASPTVTLIDPSDFTVTQFYMAYDGSPYLQQNNKYPNYANSTSICLRLVLKNTATFNKAYRLDLLDSNAFNLNTATQIIIMPGSDTTVLQIQNAQGGVLGNYEGTWKDPVLAGNIKQLVDVDLMCFNRGTQLMAQKSQSKWHSVRAYEKVENLKIGDFLKTHLHGYRKITRILRGLVVNKTAEKTQNTMCVMKKTGDMTDDLYVTGGHSLMVDELSAEEEKLQKAIGFSEKVDDKHLLLAKISPLFEAAPPGTYQHYHFLLENDDKTARYGVWANGVLCETPSQHYVENRPQI
jgi:hypothetical protein